MLLLENISYSVEDKDGNSRLLLSDISLKLDQGKHLAVIGESGCGKTTLLNFIYGLLPYDDQKVFFKEEALKGSEDVLVPGHEMMKYIPQEFDLMPFTTVFENVGEHLSIQRDDRANRIFELLEVVDLTGFENRKVKTLSGGQKQRVAIAKALAQEPKILLLDEPFSHIDNFRKNELRRRLYKYLKERDISSIIATHDKEDILGFTDDTMVLRQGKIIDNRKTTEVYHRPKNIYSASLFDEVTILSKTIFNTDNDLILYPHQLVQSKNGMEVEVQQSYFTGADFLVKASFQDQSVYFKSPRNLKSGDEVNLELRNLLD